jgi:hypothetical protein
MTVRVIKRWEMYDKLPACRVSSRNPQAGSLPYSASDLRT